LASEAAWKTDETYGAGRYPFGPCENDGCEAAACYQITDRRVCLEHKPASLFFVPFLGQQTKMFAATARWVLAGGGAGGSKTYGGARLWLKQHVEEHGRFERGEIPHSRGWFLFLRRTIPELAGVIDSFKRYMKLVCPRGAWNEQQKIFTCDCGFKVQFGGMEDDDDWQKYYGGEYTLVAIDEAWQFTKKQIQEIDSRIRCADAVLGAKVQLYLLTNPIGSETKKWMKRRFVDVADPETPVLVETKLADGRVIREWQVYIPSNLFNNPALAADGRYEANLRKKSAGMRRMLLENDWEMDEGAWVGDDWDSSRHVIDPHPIPRSWPLFKMGDYGYSSKTAIHWGAVDPEGGIVIYRSRSFKGLTAREVAVRIRQIESEPLYWKSPKTGKAVLVIQNEWDNELECSNVRGPMDAALWARSGEDGESRGEIMESMGTGFYRSDKGTNVRHQAADQIRYRLRNIVRDPFKDDGDVPGLRFFRTTTETVMVDEDGNRVKTGPTHTIPSLPADEADPDVPDTDADDHDWDALAYGVMSRPMGNSDRDEAEIIDFMVYRKQHGGGGSGSSNAPISW
jgi:hypothetical protein